jgi:hypothetical protein
MFGGGRFKDLSRHPDTVIRGGGYSSAAAGRYQFMPGTWAGAAKALGLRDFGPQAQDAAALYLMRQRGVDPNSPINAAAIAKLAPEWASLPTLAGKSYYGQPVKSREELFKFLGVPVSNAGTEAYATGQTAAPAVAPVSLPRYDFKGALKNIVLNQALQPYLSGSQTSSEAQAQIYLDAANKIEENPEQYGEDTAYDLAEQYRQKAYASMASAPTGMDSSKLIMDVINAKATAKAFDAQQAALEAQINQQRSAEQAAQQAPQQGVSIDPNAPTIGIVELGKGLLGKLGPRGLTVQENPAFGTGKVGRHAPGSLHYSSRAIDMSFPSSKRYREEAAALGRQLQQALPGAQVFHPGNDPDGGHQEHIHVGFPQGRVPVTPALRNLLVQGL